MTPAVQTKPEGVVVRSIAEREPVAATFDVVSVKPSAPGCRLSMIGPAPDGFHLQCLPLRYLLPYAFGFNTSETGRIVGEPKWASDCFDIDAKVGAASLNAFSRMSLLEKAALLQQVLTARFSLHGRMETRQLPVYALVQAKGHPALVPSQNGFTYPFRVRMLRVGELEAHAAPVADLITFISPLDGLIVIDRTGLRGLYDFKLTWNPQEMNPAAAQQIQGAPSIFTALQDQMGLTLERQRAELQTFVIDHIERPTAN